MFETYPLAHATQAITVINVLWKTLSDLGEQKLSDGLTELKRAVTNQNVVLDVRNVERVDSSGIGAFISLHVVARRFALCVTDPQLIEKLDSAKLLDYLATCGSLEEAAELPLWTQ